MVTFANSTLHKIIHTNHLFYVAFRWPNFKNHNKSQYSSPVFFNQCELWVISLSRTWRPDSIYLSSSWLTVSGIELFLECLFIRIIKDLSGTIDAVITDCKNVVHIRNDVPICHSPIILGLIFVSMQTRYQAREKDLRFFFVLKSILDNKSKSYTYQ